MYACGDLIACRSERGEGWRCTVVRSLLLAQCILLGKRACWKCYNQPEQNTLGPMSTLCCRCVGIKGKPVCEINHLVHFHRPLCRRTTPKLSLGRWRTFKRRVERLMKWKGTWSTRVLLREYSCPPKSHRKRQTTPDTS